MSDNLEVIYAVRETVYGQFFKTYLYNEAGQLIKTYKPSEGKQPHKNARQIELDGKTFKLEWKSKTNFKK